MISMVACAGCLKVRHVIDKRCTYGAGTHGPPLSLSMVENRRLTDPAEIEQALRFGEYIKQGAHRT
jgi:hypothetical protein